MVQVQVDGEERAVVVTRGQAHRAAPLGALISSTTHLLHLVMLLWDYRLQGV